LRKQLFGGKHLLASYLNKNEFIKKDNGLTKMLGLMVQQPNFKEMLYQHLIKLEQILKL
jgi:hypothetical protein